MFVLLPIIRTRCNYYYINFTTFTISVSYFLSFFLFRYFSLYFSTLFFIIIKLFSSLPSHLHLTSPRFHLPHRDRLLILSFFMLLTYIYVFLYFLNRPLSPTKCNICSAILTLLLGISLACHISTATASITNKQTPQSNTIKKL